jgi:uncharacterized protein GlcG (DUF336 family)
VRRHRSQPVAGGKRRLKAGTAFFTMQTTMAGQYYMLNGGVPLAIDGIIVGAAGAVNAP